MKTTVVDSFGLKIISSQRLFLQFLEMTFLTVIGLFRPPFRIKELFQQINFIGNGSLIIISFCVSFAAMVTIYEASFHMKMVIQNDSMVPGFASLLILRELGAVVTALLLTSRVGAGYTAEVGTMQTTEQIDALKMLGIDPIHYLVGPRLIASILSTVMLVAIANVVCILGATFVSQYSLGFTQEMFFTSMRRFVVFKDYYLSLIKGAFFGAVIPLVSCFFGFKCVPGAEGVGRATTQSVVISSISIIFLDFVLSYIFSYFY